MKKASQRRPFSYLVAGVRYEAQPRDRPREIEVIRLTFEGQGAGLVLVGAGAASVAGTS